MNHSEKFSTIATALAKAQAAFAPVVKSRTVTVQPRKREDGTWPPSYSFKYAELDAVLSAVRPALGVNELALVQTIVSDPLPDGKLGPELVRTTLLHSSGEWLSGDVPLFIARGDNASQAYASAVSYARRYGVNLLLCLAADDDDDGAGNEDGQRPQAQAQRGGSRSGPSSSGPSGPREPRSKPKGPETGEHTEPARDLPGGIHELTPGMEKMLDAKAKAAGLDREALLVKYFRVDTSNINAVLAELREAAEAAG
jgi:hypothetical protein